MLFKYELDFTLRGTSCKFELKNKILRPEEFIFGSISYGIFAIFNRQIKRTPNFMNEYQISHVVQYLGPLLTPERMRKCHFV